MQAQAHLSLESELLPSRHACFVMMRHPRIQILVELATDARGVRRLKRLVCSSLVDGPLLRRALMELPVLGEVDLGSLAVAQIVPLALRDELGAVTKMQSKSKPGRARKAPPPKG